MKNLFRRIYNWIFPDSIIAEYKGDGYYEVTMPKRAEGTLDIRDLIQSPLSVGAQKVADSMNSLFDGLDVTPIDSMDDVGKFLKDFNEKKGKKEFFEANEKGKMYNWSDYLLNGASEQFSNLSDIEKITIRFMLKDNAHEEKATHARINVIRHRPKPYLRIDSMDNAKGAHMRIENVLHYRN